MDSAPAIAFGDVRKTFDEGRVTALAGVTFAVRRGECLAIVGGSGSGKTTLLRLVNRLIEPSAGVVRVDGDDIATHDAVALRRRIGMVFQSGALFPHLDVFDNIAVTPRLLGWSSAELAARVDELLQLVRLDPDSVRHRAVAALSGGQRQRIGVARALAAKPSIVLMDEPFGALDPLTRDALGDDYRALHDNLKLTTVIVTHDITEALLLADRIAVLNNGRLLALDTPAALAQSDQPYVAELMRTPKRQAARLKSVLPEQT